jgi:hypothetical protein
MPTKNRKQKLHFKASDKEQKNILSIDKFIAKMQNAKKENKLDLSSDQDLSIALMNLISIEEHFFFSGAKTGKTEYYDLIQEVRNMRKELLQKLIPKYSDGSERWCISKHLLAASMRLMEVGTKQLDLGRKDGAYNFFQKAYNLYTLFWGINFEILDLSAIKKIDVKYLNKNVKSKFGLRDKLGKLVQKVIDCCLE